jgi:hypothetical protein
MTIGAGENVDVTDLLVQHHGTGKHKGVDNLQNATSTPSGPVAGDVWVEPISGGSGAAATATRSGTAIASIAVTNGGTGYTDAPTVTLTGGTPTTDAVLLAVISGGVVTSVSVTSGGADYSTTPTVSFTDPNAPGRLQICYADGTFTQVTSGSSAAGLSQVSSNDNTPGYLNGKLVAGTNITLTEANDGGNETLTIAALVPANIVAHYAGGTSAPTGWSIYTEGTGRVILGMDASWTLGSEVGTQFASNAATKTITEVPNHVHSVNPPSTTSASGGSHTHTYNEGQFAGDIGTGSPGTHSASNASETTSSSGSHTHAVDIAAFDSANNTSGVTSIDVTMPYVQLLPIKKDA